MAAIRCTMSLWSVWQMACRCNGVVVSHSPMDQWHVLFQNLSQSYTPVNGLRELPQGSPQDPCDPPLPSVWDWALQYSGQRRARFTQPVTQPACPPPLLNGNLNTNLDPHRVSAHNCPALPCGSEGIDNRVSSRGICIQELMCTSVASA